MKKGQTNIAFFTPYASCKFLKQNLHILCIKKTTKIKFFFSISNHQFSRCQLNCVLIQQCVRFDYFAAYTHEYMDSISL